MRRLVVIIVSMVFFAINVIPVSADVTGDYGESDLTISYNGDVYGAEYGGDYEESDDEDYWVLDFNGIRFSYTKANSPISKVKMEPDEDFSTENTVIELTIPTAFSEPGDNLSLKRDMAESRWDTEVFAEYYNAYGQLVRVPMSSSYKSVRGLFNDVTNPPGFNLVIYDGE